MKDGEKTTGRDGGIPSATFTVGEIAGDIVFSPQCGEKVQQADEGPWLGVAESIIQLKQNGFQR